MKKQYFFTIDVDIAIVVDIGHVDPGMECFCDATTFLYYHKQEHQFMMLGLKNDTESLKEGILQALHNDLILHQSLRDKDIGFVWNEYMYHRYQEKSFSPNTLIVYDQDDDWVGKKHQMWGGSDVITWLYNTPDGSIVFEAALVYPEDFSCDDFDHQEFYEWMKQYKPLFVRKISKTTLQDWIKTADQLLQDIAWMDAEGVVS